VCRWRLRTALLATLMSCRRRPHSAFGRRGAAAGARRPAGARNSRYRARRRAVAARRHAPSVFRYMVSDRSRDGDQCVEGTGVSSTPDRPHFRARLSRTAATARAVRRARTASPRRRGARCAPARQSRREVSFRKGDRSRPQHSKALVFSLGNQSRLPATRADMKRWPDGPLLCHSSALRHHWRFRRSDATVESLR
jgi:hypothetical protein